MKTMADILVDQMRADTERVIAKSLNDPDLVGRSQDFKDGYAMGFKEAAFSAWRVWARRTQPSKAEAASAADSRTERWLRHRKSCAVCVQIGHFCGEGLFIAPDEVLTSPCDGSK